MSFSNIELKARTDRAALIRQYLQDEGATFRGIDLQTDSYFITNRGRLKLRQGNIENSLIYYERGDQPGPRESVCRMMEVQDAEQLRVILENALGIRVIVKKKREIYYIRNVKFHLDELIGLGSFVEIEASNKSHPLEVGVLREQCDFYRRAFLIKDEDLVDRSCSDLLLITNYAHFR